MAGEMTVALVNLTEDDIQKLGFELDEFVAQYDITNLNERVQIRSGAHTAPSERVREYAARMKVEPCPPILLTKDDVIVDANTRVAGARKNKMQFLPAYKLNVEYASATEKEKRYLAALAAKANRHGLPLDKKEKRELVSELLGEGWTADAIGAYVGSTPSVVTQVKYESAGIEKLKRVGLSENGSLKGANLRALGKIAEINDAPFKEIADLAAEAGLNAGEIGALGKSVKGAGSDEAALALIASERTARTDGIRDAELTGSVKPPLARKLRQALGFVVNHADDDPRTMIEFSEAYVEDHIKMIEKSITVLTAVLAAQRAEA
jgi:hypothetical protein